MDRLEDACDGGGIARRSAERVGRRCYGIEIDPLYVDTAIRRWQTYGGDEAIHTASKKTFPQVATERTATND